MGRWPRCSVCACGIIRLGNRQHAFSGGGNQAFACCSEALVGAAARARFLLDHTHRHNIYHQLNLLDRLNQVIQQKLPTLSKILTRFMMIVDVVVDDD